MKQTIPCAFVLAAFLISGSADAFEQKPDSAVKMRQGFMQTQKFQLDWLKEVGKGKAPLDEVARQRAARLQMLSRILPDAFFTPSGPDKVSETNALPAVWEDAAGLGNRIERFQFQVDRLVEVVNGDSAAAVNAQVKQVVDACKACHKDYRKAEKKKK